MLSSRDASTRGLNTQERRFKTIQNEQSLRLKKSHRLFYHNLEACSKDLPTIKAQRFMSHQFLGANRQPQPRNPNIFHNLILKILPSQALLIHELSQPSMQLISLECHHRRGFQLFFFSKVINLTRGSISRQIKKMVGRNYLVVLENPAQHVSTLDQWLGGRYIQYTAYLNAMSYMPSLYRK